MTHHAESMYDSEEAAGLDRVRDKEEAVVLVEIFVEILVIDAEEPLGTSEVLPVAVDTVNTATSVIGLEGLSGTLLTRVEYTSIKEKFGDDKAEVISEIGSESDI